MKLDVVVSSKRQQNGAKLRVKDLIGCRGGRAIRLAHRAGPQVSVSNFNPRISAGVTEK
jgi:hypothetical protein